MKVYELQDPQEDRIGYWTEGHVEARLFVRAVEGAELDGHGVAVERKTDGVKHLYATISPVDPDAPASDLALDFFREPGEGRIPVTVIREDGS